MTIEIDDRILAALKNFCSAGIELARAVEVAGSPLPTLTTDAPASAQAPAPAAPAQAPAPAVQAPGKAEVIEAIDCLMTANLGAGWKVAKDPGLAAKRDRLSAYIIQTSVEIAGCKPTELPAEKRALFIATLKSTLVTPSGEADLS